MPKADSVASVSTEETRLVKMRDEVQLLDGRRKELVRMLYQARNSIIVPIVYDGKSLVPSPSARKGAREQAQKRQEIMVAAAERELGQIDQRLSELGPAIAKAKERVAEVRGGAEAKKFTTIDKALTAAIDAAPSREALKAGQHKLVDLRSQLHQVETELHLVQTQPRTLAQDATDQAARLLETGSFISEEKQPTSEQRAKELLAQQRVLREACRLQEREVLKLREQFAGEVVSGLRQIKHDIVRRMVEGYNLARSAVQEAGVLRSQFERRTQCSEYLPSFVYPRIEHPLADVQDAWSMFCDDLRRQGYEI